MRRRDLLAGVALLAPFGAVAQPSGTLGVSAQPGPSGVGSLLGPGPLPGPSLDLNFINGAALDPRISVTRAAGGATYFNSAGGLQTAAAATARIDYGPTGGSVPLGLLVEQARTNVLLNSATLSTQSVSVTAQAYTLSFYGTGSIVLSGTSTGTVAGTGATTRVSSSFTPTAGTLTVTVTGSVTMANLEAGSLPTSYIPTTTAAVARAADQIQMALGSYYNAAAGTFAVSLMMNTAPSTSQNVLDIDDNSTNNRISLGVYPGLFTANIVAGGTGQLGNNFSGLTLGTQLGIAATYATAQAQKAVATGSAVFTGSGTTAPTVTTIWFGCIAGGIQFLDGYIRRVRYWPRVLSNSELQQVTT